MQEASGSDAAWDPPGLPADEAESRSYGDAPVSAPQTGPTEVENLILGLAAQEATGCLTVVDRAGDEGLVWFRDGQVYAVSVPGPRPLLGVRLVTAGAISPEQLSEALQVQRTEMPASRLGEVLVHLRLVNRRVVENFALEQQRDMLAELLGWSMNSHWFRNGAHTRTDLAPFTDVVELIQQAHLRQEQWPLVVEEIGGRDVVPITTGATPHADLTPSESVLLAGVDGVRTLGDIADACGYTVFEAADVLLGLMAAGLVTTAHDLLDTSRWVTPDTVHLAEVLELHPARHDPETEAETDINAPGADDSLVPLAPTLPAPAAGYLPLPPPSAAPLGQPMLTPDTAPAAGASSVPATGPITIPPTGPITIPAAGPIPLPSTEAVPPLPGEPAAPQPAEQEQPAPAPSLEPADTASLLRELTSLGDLGDR